MLPSKTVGNSFSTASLWTGKLVVVVLSFLVTVNLNGWVMVLHLQQRGMDNTLVKC